MEKTVIRNFCFITPLAVREWSIVTSVCPCVFVCASVCISASISPELYVPSSPNFCTCYLWPWLGSRLSELRYVMYFRFCDDVIMAMNGPTRQRRVLKVTEQGAARI